MRLPCSFVCFVLAFNALLFATTATSHAQVAVVQPTAEELATEWDRLGRRQRPFQINKVNEFDLTGPPAAKTAISYDANTLLVLDQEGALVFWDLRTGKQINRIIPDQASADAVIDINANGTDAIVGFPSGLIQLYKPERTKPLIQFDAFKTPLTMVRYSANQAGIIAVDKFGKSWEVNLKGQSKGFQKGPSEDTPIQSLVAAGGPKGTWWKIMIDQDNQVSDVYFDGEKQTENNLELEAPTKIDASEDRFVLLSPKQLSWVVLEDRGTQEFEAKFSQVKLKAPLYDARLGYMQRFIWALSDDKLELRSMSFGQVQKSMDLPDDLPPEHTHIRPGGDALVTITPQGHVTRWAAYVEADDSIETLLISLGSAYQQGRFDAYEAIAEKWNGRIDDFENDSHETPYTFLMRAVQRRAIGRPGEQVKTYPDIEAWIENNPDNCKFMRIALFRLYLADGYRARGEGFANTVTEEGWKTFYANMEKSWEVIEPIFDQKDAPAEAYTCAVIAGKNLQWDRDIINQYLRLTFEKYPTYHRTFTEEAVARLPRWGGKPGETEYLARFTADKIGGIEGDMLYAKIAQNVSRYLGWDNMDVEARFSRERVLKGLLALAKLNDNNETINLTLYLAGKWEDEETGLAAANREIDLLEMRMNQPIKDREEMAKRSYEHARKRHQKPSAE